MDRVDVFTLEVPGEPLPQLRHRVRMWTPSSRRARRSRPKAFFYDPPTSKRHKIKISRLVSVALAEAERSAFDGPVRIDVSFYFAKPKSRVRKSTAELQLPKDTKPDVDNLVKALMDGLEMGGLFSRGDSQVVELHARKVYGPVDQLPRTNVVVRSVRPE